MTLLLCGVSVQCAQSSVWHVSLNILEKRRRGGRVFDRQGRAAHAARKGCRVRCRGEHMNHDPQARGRTSVGPRVVVRYLSLYLYLKYLSRTPDAFQLFPIVIFL